MLGIRKTIVLPGILSPEWLKYHHLTSCHKYTKMQEHIPLSGAQVRASCISESSRRAYASCINSISRWIEETQEDSGRFFDELGSIDLSHFTHVHFEKYLLYRLNTPGKELTASSMGGYWSAMKDLYRTKRIDVPAAYEADMKTFFSGLKRIESSKIQRGDKKDTGKSAMTFSKYVEFCSKTLSLHDNGFAHLFCIAQWNLMCRSKSVQTIQTTHLLYADDSIGCVLHQTKTNQEGSGPKDPRHLYANPINPKICFITALALYLACNPRLGPGPLFPGSNQRHRFGQLLIRVVNSKEIGTHSIRGRCYVCVKW